MTISQACKRILWETLIIASLCSGFCTAQTLTPGDLVTLETGSTVPSTHLEKALGMEAKRSLGPVYGPTLGSPDGQQSDLALNQLVQNYKAAKSQNDIGFSILKANDYIVKTAIVGGLTYSGAGAIAAPAAGVVSDLVLGQVESSFTDAAKNDLQRLLKTGLSQVQSTNQTEYNRLLTITDPKQFLSSLDTDVNGLFGTALNALPQEDQETVDAFRLKETTEIMKDGFGWVSSTVALQQNEIDSSRQDIVSLAKTFDQFSADITTSVNDVAAKEQDLENSVATLQGDFGGQQTEIEYLQTSLYGTLSPQQRMIAIQNGLLDNLSPAAKQELTEENDVEVKSQALQQAIGTTLNGAADLVNIAKNVGVSPALLNDAQTGLAIAGDAATAFTDFSSGNILGGISAASNIFGIGGPDVNAIRYQQILQSLGVIDDKLTVISQKEDQLLQGEQAIIQNQQQELNALNDLSKQLEADHENEMDQIQKTDGDVLYNRSLMVAAATKSYGADCPYILVNQNGPGGKPSPYIDTARQVYPSEKTFISLYTSSKAHFTGCFDLMMKPRQNGGTFDSNIFDLQSFASADPVGVQSVVTQIYEPALFLLEDPHIVVNASDTNSQRFNSLFVPVTTYRALLAKESTVLQPYNFRFSVPVTDHLQSLHSTEHIIEHATIATNVHFYFMLFDPNTNIRPWRDLVSAADVRLTGVDVLNDTLELLDIGIGQQQLMSGDSLLPIIDEVMTQWTTLLTNGDTLGCLGILVANMPQACKDAFTPFALQLLSEGVTEAERTATYNKTAALLASDSNLAKNYLLYKVSSLLLKNGTSVLSYAFALAGKDPALLQSCTDKTWTFTLSPQNQWFVAVGTKALAMPTPNQVQSGSFFQATEMQQLLTMRNRVTDELATYSVLNVSDVTLRTSMNTLLLMGIPLATN